MGLLQVAIKKGVMSSKKGIASLVLSVSFDFPSFHVQRIGIDNNIYEDTWYSIYRLS